MGDRDTELMNFSYSLDANKASLTTSADTRFTLVLVIVHSQSERFIIEVHRFWKDQSDVLRLASATTLMNGIIGRSIKFIHRFGREPLDFLNRQCVVGLLYGHSVVLLLFDELKRFRR